MYLPDITQPTDVYNDNQACVDRSSTVTTKGIKHVNLHENRVREAQVDGQIQVKHIPGIINSADIFTKELKDSAHFCRLRDSFMVSSFNSTTVCPLTWHRRRISLTATCLSFALEELVRCRTIHTVRSSALF